MIEVKNTTDSQIETVMGLKWEGGETQKVSEATLANMRREPYANGQLIRGNLLVEGEDSAEAANETEAPDVPAVTREDINKMGSADLEVILETHGLAKAAIKGKKVAELRQMAINVVFI